MKLGEILVRQGLIDRDQLATALTHQLAQGSRLGTFLVENNILSSDQINLALAEQCGVPAALEADFLRADPALRKRLLVHQAIELQSIPLFFLGTRQVAVAMANPTNPRALDRLTFILGATVVPLVASEATLNQQFELLYRVRRKRPPQNRRSSPANENAHKRAGSRVPPSEEVEIPPALRSYRRRTKALHFAPLEPGKRIPEAAAPVAPMEDALCFTPTPLSSLPRAPVRTPPTPTRVVSRHTLTPIVVPITNAGAQLAVEQIRLATDQQDLSDNLFTFMRTSFSVGAMFAVAGTKARGLFGFSDGRVCPAVEDLEIPLWLPSCFRIARSRRTTFRGLPPPDGGAVHGPLWTALRSPKPTDVLVAPVIVDKQVTLLLYAEGECGGRINDLAASKMQQVCEALSSSILRLAI
jgi:hypothetical protein